MLADHPGQGEAHSLKLTAQIIIPALFQAQYGSSGIPSDLGDGLPTQSFYQPEKSPVIPVVIGERSEKCTCT